MAHYQGQAPVGGNYAYDRVPLAQGGDPPQNPYADHGHAQPYAGHTSHMSNPLTMVFFVAAVCVIVGSFIAGISLLLNWQILDALAMIFMLMFGLLLAALDTPFFTAHARVRDTHTYLAKYVHILTRFTGKGAFLIFLAANLFMAMYVNSVGHFTIFLVVVLNLVIFGAGVAAIIYGLLKSVKLKKSKDSLDIYTMNARLNQYAKTYSPHRGGNGEIALTADEFNKLTSENGGCSWNSHELYLIFNALVMNPSWQTAHHNKGAGDQPKITQQDLVAWVEGGFVAL